MITTFRRPTLLQQLLMSLVDCVNPIYIWLNGPKNDLDSSLIEESLQVISRFPNLNVLKVKTNDKHFSSGNSIASAITWVFEHENSAIVLEDDIIPSKLFLWNTSNLLEIYSSNFKVGSILGSNFVPESHITHNDFLYRSTDFVSSWGWATWADRWKLFENELGSWSDYREVIPKSTANFFGLKKWKSIFDSIKSGSSDAWDYRWQFTSWKNSWVHLVPNSNLVLNVGFDTNATHTFEKPKWLVECVAEHLPDFPLVSTSLDIDLAADAWVTKHIHPSSNWYWIKTYANKVLRR